MSEDFAPTLRPVEIAILRPTQMTVGFREIKRKRGEWCKRAERDGPDFLGRHMIPVILGPKHTPYVIDHHHLVRALHEEGISHVLVSVVADLHHLKKQVFWTFMDNRNWLHPFDADGTRHSHDQLPKRVADMKDDPYRSLAGELRRSGGYAKDATPYSEFLWADFLRRRISAKLVEHDFARAVSKALKAAGQGDAAYLPGWCGQSGDTDG
ncbi:chromosome partitioning protein ParB [Sphingomonas sp. AP4-R1]|uniref:ParB-like protein n=1 Tax=Sphingomonas sp. AP4-R1 TaxID=2735134 RepID=UPI0014939B39|nr:ParB-like protein [Sphingomonas sp. AP4-R1]QJU59315.1 chromosome partitioning protein ParB [Sphingomonas sp. AP4-R1]